MMMRGGAEDNYGVRMNVMPPQLKTTPAETPAIAGGGGGGGQRAKEEKFSQWGLQETKELIAIRAEFERDFTGVRRIKTLWEAVSSRMKEKGFSRSPDQCKCKWKNLVSRYRDRETGEAENGRHCPFFEELHSVFSLKNSKKPIGERSYDELSGDDEDDGEDGDEERPNQSKRRKAEKSTQQQQHNRAAGKSKTVDSIHELLQDFMQKQQQIESHWWETAERRAFERQRFEQDWRQSMEKLERERLMLERACREREEQRRMREECRAEKRDALLTALLNKLIQNDL